MQPSMRRVPLSTIRRPGIFSALYIQPYPSGLYGIKFLNQTMPVGFCRKDFLPSIIRFSFHMYGLLIPGPAIRFIQSNGLDPCELFQVYFQVAYPCGICRFPNVMTGSIHSMGGQVIGMLTGGRDAFSLGSERHGHRFLSQF